jgi:cyclopropane fatty-acyl-phospholipid synthase-like methyltransferase
MLACAGYRVVGTTISYHDIALANKKVEALRCKKPTAELEFQAWPMESVDEAPGFRAAFDGAFVYEALHHAYDWRKALHAVAATLKKGGTFVLAHEPNRAHTFVSYRVAKLSHTHEIGFRKKDLTRELRAAGFEKIQVLQPKIDNLLTFFWIIATKGP